MRDAPKSPITKTTPPAASLKLASILALCLAVAAARPAVATTYTWAVSSGTFSTPGSWTPTSPAGPPIATDTATFSLASTYTTTFTTSPVNALLNQTAGNVTFTSSAAAHVYTLTTTTISGGTLLLTGSTQNLQLVAGNTTLSGASTVTVNQGNDLTAAGLSIGTVAGGTTSSLIFDGVGSTLTSTLGTILGANGSVGALTFQNAASGTIGSLTATSGTVSGSGSQISVLSDADVTFGGAISLGTAGGTSQSSNMTISGTGSTVVQTGSNALSVGAAAGGTAELDILASGSFTGAAGGLSILNTGFVNVNAGTLVANSDITITGGKLQVNATGTLTWAAGKNMTVQSGGTFTTSSDFAAVTGTVNISGAGSSMSVGNRLYAVIGGQVNITGGATADVTSILNIGTNASGTITVDGPGSTLNVHAQPADQSTLGGGGNATLTFSNSAVGSLSTLLSLGGAISGTQNFNVLSGAHVSVSNLYVGIGGTAGTQQVTVSGANSVLSTTADLVMGQTSGNSAGVTVNGASLLMGTLTATKVGASYGTGNFLQNPTALLTIINGNVALGLLNGATGTLDFESGRLGIRGSATLAVGQMLGANLNLNSAQALAVSGTLTVPIGSTLTLSGGGLSVGNLVVNGAFHFNSGALELTQSLTVGTGQALGSNLSIDTGQTLYADAPMTVNSGAVVTVAGGELDTAGINNSGSILIQAAAHNSIFSATGTLVNSATGRLVIGAGQVISLAGVSNSGRVELDGAGALLGGTGTFSNGGLIIGSGEIALPLTSTTQAEIRATAGSDLLFSSAGGALISGRVNLQGGTVEFTQPVTIGFGAIVSGHGMFSSPAGISNFSQFQLSGGNADIYGPFTNTSSGKIIVSGNSTTTFYDPVSLNFGSTTSVAADSTLVFFANVTGTDTITGTGTVDFEAGQSTMSTSLVVTNVMVQSGANLTAGSFQSSQLTVGGKASIGGPVSNSGTSKLSSLSLAGSTNNWAGTFDLNNNKLILQATAATKTAMLGNLQNQVLFGGAHAQGIVSTGLPANTGIAVIDNGSLPTPFTSFGGLGVDTNSILVAPELLGDANADGVVNFADFILLSNHFGLSGAGWTGGDFNNDNTTNFADFIVLSNHFGLSLPGASDLVTADEIAAFHEETSGFAAAATGVPEPATLTLLAAALAAPTLRRRKNVQTV